MNEPPQSQSTELGAELATVASLVNYKEGSIVSREIVKKLTGSMTVFAFDEGQGLSEHTVPFDALVQVIEGEAEITVAGKPNRVASGENDSHACAPAARPQSAVELQNDFNQNSVLNVRPRGGILHRICARNY